MAPNSSEPALPFPSGSRTSRADPNYSMTFVDKIIVENAQDRVWRMSHLRTHILSYLSKSDCVRAMPTCRAWLWPLSKNLYHTIPLLTYEKHSDAIRHAFFPDLLRMKMNREHVVVIYAKDARRQDLSALPAKFPGFQRLVLRRTDLRIIDSGCVPTTGFPHLVYDREFHIIFSDAKAYREPPFDPSCYVPKQWTIQPRTSLLVQDYDEPNAEWRDLLTGYNALDAFDARERWHELREWFEGEEAKGQYEYPGRDKLVADIRSRLGVFKSEYRNLDIRLPLSTEQLISAFSAPDDRRFPRLSVVCADYNVERLSQFAHILIGRSDHLILHQPRLDNLDISLEDLLNTLDWSTFRCKRLEIDVTHPASLTSCRQSSDPACTYRGPPLHLLILTITFHSPIRLPKPDETTPSHESQIPSDFMIDMANVKLMAEALLSIGGPCCEYTLAVGDRGMIGKGVAQAETYRLTGMLRDSIEEILGRDVEEKGWAYLGKVIEGDIEDRA